MYLRFFSFEIKKRQIKIQNRNLHTVFFLILYNGFVIIYLYIYIYINFVYHVQMSKYMYKKPRHIYI